MSFSTINLNGRECKKFRQMAFRNKKRKKNKARFPYPSVPAEVSYNINEKIFQKKFLPGVKRRGGRITTIEKAEEMQPPSLLSALAWDLGCTCTWEPSSSKS